MSKTISPVEPSTIREIADRMPIARPAPKTALTPDAIAKPSTGAQPDLRTAAHGVAAAKPATSALGPDVSGIPYADQINAAAHANGLPPALLAGLIQEESSFRPGVVSSTGAVGLTQLEPATAKSMGVTDPYDPAQNIDGGAKYLKSLIDTYHGSIPTALAAYNAGPGNVAKAGGVPPSYTLGYIANIDTYAKGFAHGQNVPLETLPSSSQATAPAAGGGTPVRTGPAASPPASRAGMLQEGSSGNAVRVLQDQLGVTADGDFGPKTKAAVERFQRTNGLEVDGVVGPQTRAALAASRPELSEGATGNDVRAIQQAVGATVDGDFGPKTKAAVENFQRSHGLHVDGIVGPKTWAAIEGASPAKSAAPAPPTGGRPVATGPSRTAPPATVTGSANAANAKTLSIAQQQAKEGIHAIAGGQGTDRDSGDGRVNAYQSTTGAYDEPWCASFVSWCEQQSGGTPYRNASVDNWVAQAKNNQSNLHAISPSQAKPGDLVAFDWDGGGFKDHDTHIGIVQSVNANGTVTFVSGNYDNGKVAVATLPIQDTNYMQFIGVGHG